MCICHIAIVCEANGCTKTKNNYDERRAIDGDRSATMSYCVRLCTAYVHIQCTQMNNINRINDDDSYFFSFSAAAAVVYKMYFIFIMFLWKC